MNQRRAWLVRRGCRGLLPLGAAAGLLAGALFLGLAGCQSIIPRGQAPEEPENRFDYKQIKTIGDVTDPANLTPIQVSGVGLVVNLDGTGGGPPRDGYTNLLKQQLLKQRVQGVEELLQSPNTAVVLLTGIIPAGARKGDTIDLQVSLPQGSKVISLRGGYLQQTVLRNYDSKRNISPQYQGSDMLLPGHILGVARGPVLVGLGAGDDTSRLKHGVVWEGGVSLIDRPLALVLKKDQSFARVANSVAERINLMFPNDARKREEVLLHKRLMVLDEVTGQLNDKFRPSPTSRGETAKAITKDVVYAQVPHVYRLNPEHYLRVARFIPLRESMEVQTKYRQRLAQMLLDPERTISAALRLEALGRDSVSFLEPGLKSPYALVRFAAAEALAYLENTGGVDELARLSEQYDVLRAYGLTALASLNEHACRVRLEGLLYSPNPEMRYGAFKGLRIMDGGFDHIAAVRGELLNDSYWLHRAAPTAAQALVHISTGSRPELVLFGEEPRLAAPLRLLVGEFTVVAAANDDRCTISRYELGPNRTPLTKQCSFRLEDVLRTMADLGGQYGEAVDLLKQVELARCLPGCTVAVDALPQALPVEVLASEGKTPRYLAATPAPFVSPEDSGATPLPFQRGGQRTYVVEDLPEEPAPPPRRGPAGN